MSTIMSLSIVAGVNYHRNSETGDHIFKGTEADLREQVEEMGMGVDDEPQYHVVTGALLDSDLKKIWGPTGDKCGYLVRPKKNEGWMLVIGAKAL